MRVVDSSAVSAIADWRCWVDWLWRMMSRLRSTLWRPSLSWWRSPLFRWDEKEAFGFRICGEIVNVCKCKWPLHVIWVNTRWPLFLPPQKLTSSVLFWRCSLRWVETRAAWLSYSTISSSLPSLRLPLPALPSPYLLPSPLFPSHPLCCSGHVRGDGRCPDAHRSPALLPSPLHANPLLSVAQDTFVEMGGVQTLTALLLSSPPLSTPLHPSPRQSSPLCCSGHVRGDGRCPDPHISPALLPSPLHPSQHQSSPLRCSGHVRGDGRCPDPHISPALLPSPLHPSPRQSSPLCCSGHVRGDGRCPDPHSSPALLPSPLHPSPPLSTPILSSLLLRTRSWRWVVSRPSPLSCSPPTSASSTRPPALSPTSCLTRRRTKQPLSPIRGN